MTALLALLGGQEHTTGCEDIDRRLLEETGSRVPHVTVVLAATSPRRRAYKMQEALSYWEAMGVPVQFAMNGGPDELGRSLAALEDPDLVVMTGGHPWLLHARLEGSQVLARIRALAAQGVPLAGSSAGAIAMCEWRQHFRPPNPLKLVRAFGLVPGTAAAPHFDLYGLDHVVTRISRRYPHLEILGLDDKTAVIGRDDDFKVYGRGAVTVVQGGRLRRFPSGASLRLGAATA
jgi:cyanophycinase